MGSPPTRPGGYEDMAEGGTCSAGATEVSGARGAELAGLGRWGRGAGLGRCSGPCRRDQSHQATDPTIKSIARPPKSKPKPAPDRTPSAFTPAPDNPPSAESSSANLFGVS